MRAISFVIMFLMFGCSFAEPKGSYDSLYCNVNDSMEDPFYFFGNCIKSTTDNIPADYIISNGDLFLRFQSTRSSSVAIIVDNPEWDKEKLDKLISNKPELIGYLPNKDEPLKGISWIKNKR